MNAVFAWQGTKHVSVERENGAITVECDDTMWALLLRIRQTAGGLFIHNDTDDAARASVLHAAGLVRIVGLTQLGATYQYAG